jgi:protein TonB
MRGPSDSKEEVMPNARCFFLGLSLGLIALPSTATLPQQAGAEYDTPPKAIKITKPEYPPEALEEKIEGTVMVEITITTTGTVLDPVVIQSVEGLDEAALECVREWQFKPAEKDGEAVSTTAHAPVAFHLPDATDVSQQDEP